MFKLFIKDKTIEKKLENIERNHKDDEIIRQTLLKEKLPIVILDPLWYSVKDQLGNSNIEKKEVILKELLKEQGKLNNDYKDYMHVKQKLLSDILNVSQLVNGGEEEKIEELDKLQKSVVKANEKLEEIDNRIKEVEIEIERINREIIEETIAIGYGYIRTYAKTQQELEAEIDFLRAEVVKKTEEKKQYEQKMTNMYTYLHSVVGHKNISKVDKELWDEQ